MKFLVFIFHFIIYFIDKQTNMSALKIVHSGSIKRTFTCPHCSKEKSGDPGAVSSWIQRHINYCEGISESELAFCLQAVGKSPAGMRRHTRIVNGNFIDYSPEVKLPTRLPHVHTSSPLRHEIVQPTPQVLISDEERAQIWAELIADDEKEKEKNKKKTSGKKKV